MCSMGGKIFSLSLEHELSFSDISLTCMGTSLRNSMSSVSR